MNSPCQFCCHHLSMIPMPYQPLNQPPFIPNYPFSYQQPHFQHQSSIQLQTHQQYKQNQEQYHQQQYYYKPRFHQQPQQHFLHQQQFQQNEFDHPYHVPIIFNNRNAQSETPYGYYSYENPQRINNQIAPQNYNPTNDTQPSHQSASNITFIPKEMQLQTISEETKADYPFELQVSVDNGGKGNAIKLEYLKDEHELSSSQHHLNIKEESRLLDNFNLRIPKIKTILPQIPTQLSEDFEEKLRTSSKSTYEMVAPIVPKCELESTEKNNQNEYQPENDIGNKEDLLKNPNDSIEQAEDKENSISESEKRPISKQKKIAIQKTEKRKIKEKLLGISSSAQKQLLLEINLISKQSPAKALLKAFAKFGLGKQEYIYNYDISENQYYYKLCHDMPLIRIEDPSKKDLEGFYRKLKKFFQGKQYNNSTLKTIVRNKLYGQLFDDFLHKKVDEWLELTKSKNKDDIRLVIRFLRLCHQNTDYLIFLRETDKSNRKQRFEDLSE